jgi:lysophospholipase L1-like esterase
VPNLYERAANFIYSFRKKAHYDEFASIRGQHIDIDKKTIKNKFELNLQTFINICGARNIKPVLMTQQNRFTGIPDALISETVAKKLKKDFDIEYKDYKEVYDLLNQTTREAGQKNGVMVIDLDKEIPHTKEFMYDLVHFNDNGSKLAAERISKKLLPIIRR